MSTPQLYDRVAQERDELRALVGDLVAALEDFLKEYVDMVNSGDCGFWDPEEEPKVKAARAALAKTRGEGP